MDNKHTLSIFFHNDLGSDKTFLPGLQKAFGFFNCFIQATGIYHFILIIDLWTCLKVFPISIRLILDIIAGIFGFIGKIGKWFYERNLKKHGINV